jgi:hypothetical protein
VHVTDTGKEASMDDDFCRQHGMEILRLHKELKRAEASVSPGMARPSSPGSEARSVSRTPAELDAEGIRARLVMAEERYRARGCTCEYLQALADEVAKEGSGAGGEAPDG